MSDLLTIPGAAKRLGVSRWTVYRLIADGALDVTDIARPGSKRTRSRVPAESVQAFVACRTRNAATR